MQFDLFDETQNRILGAKTYSDFKKALIDSACTRCGLSKSRTHIVVDRGNPQAKILIIGEGPGEQEDLKGQAFVGRAGQLLDQILASVKLDSNRDALIANVVKCRPPENRTPSKEEAETCLPYLYKQIELVHPRVILLLGATALKHILPGKTEFSMEEEAGKFFIHPAFPDIQFMVLYHPAYLLYDPRKKPVMWEHVKRLRAYLEKEGLV